MRCTIYKILQTYITSKEMSTIRSLQGKFNWQGQACVISFCMTENRFSYDDAFQDQTFTVSRQTYA